MPTLPDSVTHLFLVFFLGSLSVFVLLPACISYWRLVHGSLSPTRQGFVRLKDIPAMLVALALTNAFCYVLGSGSAHPIPHDVLRWLLMALDLPFFLFFLDTIIVSLLVKRIKRAVWAIETSTPQLPTNETVDARNPSHPANPEKTTISSPDGVPVRDN